MSNNSAGQPAGVIIHAAAVNDRDRPGRHRTAADSTAYPRGPARVGARRAFQHAVPTRGRAIHAGSKRGMTAAPDPEAGIARPWKGLTVILTAVFMAMFDIAVINVAAPSIQQGLNTSEVGLRAAASASTFSYAAALIIGGRLGDRFGRRRLFLQGMTLFGLASVLCGLAPDISWLVAGRLLQGLGGAGMIPQCLALISVIYPERGRSQALMTYGTVLGIGAIAGQLLGGLLVSADLFGLSWRPVFLVNVLVALLVVTNAPRYVPEARSGGPVPLDLVGLFGLTLTAGLIIIPLLVGGDQGWPSWTLSSIQAGFSVFVLFISWEGRLARQGGHPIIPPAIIKIPKVWAGLFLGAAYNIFYAPFLLTFAIFLQAGQHRSAATAGIVLLPLDVTFVAASLAARRLNLGARSLTIGALLSLTGLAVIIAGLRDTSSAASLTPGLILVGAGSGFFTPALIAIVLADAPRDHSSSISALLSTCIQFGSALGIAGIGAVFYAGQRTDGYAAGLRAALAIDLLVIATAAVVSLRALGSRSQANRARHRRASGRASGASANQIDADQGTPATVGASSGA